MSYQILYPYQHAIDSDSFAGALKTFFKMNYNAKLNNFIIKDNVNAMRGNVKYYKKGNKKRLGFNMYPIGLNQIPQYMTTYNNLNGTTTSYVNSLPGVYPNVQAISTSRRNDRNLFSPVRPISPVFAPVAPVIGGPTRIVPSRPVSPLVVSPTRSSLDRGGLNVYPDPPVAVINSGGLMSPVGVPTVPVVSGAQVVDMGQFTNALSRLVSAVRRDERAQATAATQTPAAGGPPAPRPGAPAPAPAPVRPVAGGFDINRIPDNTVDTQNTTDRTYKDKCPGQVPHLCGRDSNIQTSNPTQGWCRRTPGDCNVRDPLRHGGSGHVYSAPNDFYNPNL